MCSTLRIAVWVLAVLSLPIPAGADCPPGRPQNLTAEDRAECIGVHLNWNNVAAADYYEVWRHDTDDYNSSNRVSAPGLPLTSDYDDLTALPGHVYFYWVTAYQIDVLCGIPIANHRSLPSDSDPNTGGPQGVRIRPGAAPSEPDEMGASDGIDCSGVEVQWTDVVANTYNVYRAPYGGTFGDATEIAYLFGNINFYTDENAVPGQLYTYWVVANNLCGSSSHSNSDTGWRASPLQIASQPQPQSPTPCQNTVFFDFAASGGNTVETYQWRRGATVVTNGPGGASPGGGTVSGATTGSLMIAGPRPSDQGNYTCRITNACGTVTSNAAALTLCPTDVDCDRQITPADVSLFVTRWFLSLQNGTLVGDFDFNGEVEPADVSLFVATWFAAVTNGC